MKKLIGMMLMLIVSLILLVSCETTNITEVVEDNGVGAIDTIYIFNNDTVFIINNDTIIVQYDEELIFNVRTLKIYDPTQMPELICDFNDDDFPNLSVVFVYNDSTESRDIQYYQLDANDRYAIENDWVIGFNY